MVAEVSVAVAPGIAEVDVPPIAVVAEVSVPAAAVSLEVTPVSLTAVSVFAFSSFLHPNANSATARRQTTVVAKDFLIRQLLQ